MKIILTFLMLFSLIPECKSQEFDAYPKGGYDSLYTAIKQETLLPDSCEQPGKVFVSFTISETGDIKDARIARGICPQADSVALNIVKRIKYKPAKRNGKPVAKMQTLQIYFTREN